jgi:hypothetical protein
MWVYNTLYEIILYYILVFNYIFNLSRQL